MFGLKVSRIYNKIYIFFYEVKENHLDVYSAGAAFYTFISIIPFFIALFSVVPFTPMTRDDVLSLSEMLPDEFSIMVQAISAEAYVKSSTRLWISLITGIWSAARGVMYMTKGLNEIYDVREKRNYFVLRFKAAVYTLLLVIALIILLIFGVFGKKIHGLLADSLPHLPENISSVLTAIIDFRDIITIVCLFLLFIFLYTVLPSKKMEVVYQLPGAAISAVGWWAFTGLFSMVTGTFNLFSMYGTLATVVASMLWMYCCMYIMFICAEINCHFARLIITFIHERRSRRNAGNRRGAKKSDN